MKRWIRCRGTVPAVMDAYVSPYSGEKIEYVKRAARPCAKEARMMEYLAEGGDVRPVCDDCAELFSTKRYLRDYDFAIWGQK